MPPAGWCEAIKSRAASGVGVAPLALEPLFLLESMQCGIEGAVLDLELALCALLDPSQRGESVHRAPRESAKDQQVERAADDVQVGRCSHDGPSSCTEVRVS